MGESWMRANYRIRLHTSSACAVLAVLNLAAVHPVVAASPAETVSPITTVQDVVLTAEGQLEGRVVRAAGAGMPAVTVVVRAGQQQVARLTTDPEGRFATAGLAGGLYLLATPDTAQTVRVWQPGTAPPQARRAALIVTGPTVRGQFGPVRPATPGHFDGALLKALSHPAVISGLTAAAIAVPLAVDGDDAS
jgi:hypothetical protein